MAIDAEKIMRLLKSYVRTDRGKRIIHEKIKGIISGSGTGGGNIVTTAEMTKLANELKNLIVSYARNNNVPESVVRHVVDIVISSPEDISNNGASDDIRYSVKMSFPKEIGRNSLLITSGKNKGRRTGDGVDDSVRMFNYGYSANGRVYGVWDGHEELGVIPSKPYRAPTYFVDKAIEDFLGMYEGTYDISVNWE